MNRSKVCLIISIVVMLAVAISACQPKVATGGEETTAGETTTGETTTGETTTGETTTPTGRAAEFRIALLSDMTSQNVWYLYDQGGSSYWNYAPQTGQWPPLVTLSDQRYDIIPYLAAELPGPFTQEGEYWVNTITMKEGMVWSDGSPVTADDVAFTINTALFFKLGLNWQSSYNPDYLIKAEAVDPLTVKYFFNTEPGLSLWQYGTMQGVIVSKAYWEPKIAEAVAMVTADPNTLPDAVTLLENLDPAGEPTYGVFKVNTWEVGAYVEDLVNENNFFIGTTVQEYANGAYREFNEENEYEYVAYGTAEGDTILEYTAGPYFDAVVYSLYDQDSAILALKDNEVDFILNPSGWSLGAIKQLEGDPGITISENKQNGFRYLTFNQNRPYFQGEAGVAFRQAVACIVNLDFLAETALQGQVLPVYTMVPEGNGFWFNPDVTKYCQGMDEPERFATAMQYLKDAGYTWDIEPTYNDAGVGSRDTGIVYGEGLKMPNGEYFPEITMLAPSAGYDPLRATSAIYIESWMKELAIPVTAELTAFNNITNAAYNTGDFDMFILGWSLSIYPDYICTFFNNGDGTNPYGYVSPTLQGLCEEFLLETDLMAAKDLAFQIQDLLATELPYITIFTNPIRDAWRNVTYPYTQLLDGLGGALYGAPSFAVPVAVSD